ncbi:MAG: fibronectin type III domain-containing protein [Verrucomicrobiia bacterium]
MSKLPTKKLFLIFLPVALLIFVGMFFPKQANATAFFTDDFSSGSTNWTPTSGFWTVENGVYKQKEGDMSNSVTASPSTFFSDNFNAADGPDGSWSNNYSGSFAISNNVYAASASGGSSTLSVPSSSSLSNQSDYKITTKIQMLGASNVNGYAIVYFRLNNANTGTESGYGLLFRETGVASLWRRTGGSWSSLIKEFTIPEDNNWHNVIIEVVGSTIKVWFAKDDSQPYDMIASDTTYTTGTVGLGTRYWTSNFDDFSVESILTVTTATSHMYQTDTNTISTIASLGLDSSALTVANPLGTTWYLSNPSSCSGAMECSVVFPTDFAGANTDVLGTYKITASDGSNTFTSFFEMEEKPLLTFVDMTDIHSDTGDLTYSVTNITNGEFPLPNFVVVTGDLSNNGLSNELAQVKTPLDTLPVPYHPTIGNHDSGNGGTNDVGTNGESGNTRGQIWSSIFGSNDFSYSWTVGNFLFLAMDIDAPYGGYGYSIASTAHTNWLQNILAANLGKYVFLFDHYDMEQPRDGGGARDYWADGWDGVGSASTIRSILESQGKVIAGFSGHAHLNAFSETNGICYVLTGSFANTSDSYRYVEVYTNRITSHIIKRATNYNYTGSDTIWPGSSDSTHSTSTYGYGLPFERQFSFNYLTKNSDILDAISVTGNSAWTDYSFQADVTLNHEDLLGENVAGLAFRYTDNNNYYSVMLDSSADTINLYKKQAGTVTQLASVSTPIDIGTTYTVKVTAQGSNINAYLNDVLEINTTDTTFSAGAVGLRTYLAATSYGNVSITDLAAPTNVGISSIVANSTTQLTVTANTAIDLESGLATAPYQFKRDSTELGWQVSSTLYDANLSANTQYTYEVQAKDTTGNESGYSDPYSKYTLANIPSSPTVTPASATSLNATINENSNPAGTTFSIKVGGQYAQADGSLGVLPVYQTKSAWETPFAITGLSPNTRYTISVNAQNGDGVTTDYSASSSKYTSANVPSSPTLTASSSTSLSATINENSNPAITTFSIKVGSQYAQANGSLGASPVYQTKSAWGSVSITGLSANTQYAVSVNAQNGDGVTTGYSATSSKYTSANAPSSPTLTASSSTSLSATINENGNPAITTFSIKVGSQYVQADGTLGASAVYQTKSAWGSVSITGLSPNTRYTISVNAQNGDTAITDYSTTTPTYTLAPTPTNFTGSAAFASVFLSVDSFANDTAGSSGYYFSRTGGDNSGWIQTNTWQDTGLSCGASYTYSVQYRNGDGVPTGSISLNIATTDCTNTLLGAYNGLVIQTNVPSHASSGSVKFMVGKTRSFTAQLTMGGVKSAFKGQFDASGNATNTVTRNGLAPLQVILHSDGSDRIMGTVSNDVFASELLADRAVYNRTNSCPLAGSYTVVLAPPEGSDPDIPQGYGYGTLSVTTIGGGKLSGVLGDGTKVKGNVPVSKYGTWPLYDALYKKQGSCIGWVTFATNSTLEATVDWFRPSMLVSNYYLSLLGSMYVVPAVGEPMLELTNTTGNALLTLGDGNLTGVLSNLLTVASNNTVTILSGNITNLTLKLTPKTGLFSGGFWHPATGKTTKFQGAVLQLQDFGAGYFLGTNESGYVTFESPTP